MFYLQELFDDLAYGEFANVAVSNPLSKPNIVDEYPKLVSWINRGLLDLYTRFKIEEKEVVFTQEPGKTSYTLIPETTLIDLPSQEELPDSPIMFGDSAVTFGGSPLIYGDESYIGTSKTVYSADEEIIRLLDAYDSTGCPVSIDDPSDPMGISTVGYNRIKMLQGDTLKTITVVYQASAPKIIISENFDPASYPLYVPYFLKRAITAYVLGMLLTGKTRKDQEQKPSNHFYAYESECHRLKALGLIPDKAYEKTTFTRYGWV